VTILEVVMVVAVLGVIANHLLADGSVRSLGVSIDAEVYMFLITRGGNGPAG
jgi:hypothetical protein